MSGQDLAELARKLGGDIASESDARKRMKLCRQALGLGRSAVKSAADLTDDDIKSIQSSLRLAHRASRGTFNPNVAVTKLAQTLMNRAGLTELDIIAATRSRTVVTDTASLAIADQELPDDWWDTKASLAQMNEGRYFHFTTGADGRFSVTLRLIAGTELFLQPKEYKQVLEVSPIFRVVVGSGRVQFGSAEDIVKGVSIPAETGPYLGTVTSLRSSHGPRFIATLIRSDAPVDPIHQTVEMTEL